MHSNIQLRVRVYCADVIAIGPGKVQLLETIEATGSIAAAARQLGMSYRRAWMLVSEMNNALVAPAVIAVKGGPQGGGAALSETGTQIVRHYRAMEASALTAAARDIAALNRLLALPSDTDPNEV